MKKFQLTKFPETRYTMTENHLFDLLPQNGRKVSSANMAAGREGLGEWEVAAPLKNITVHMNNLIAKIDSNGEPFQLVKDGKYPGHPMVEYWLEPRPRKKKKNGK